MIATTTTQRCGENTNLVESVALREGSRTWASHDDRQGSASGAGEGKRTNRLESGTTDETVTAGAGTYRVAKREERRITLRDDHQLATRGGKASRAEFKRPEDDVRIAGAVWAWVLIWAVTADHVRTIQHWDWRLGFRGEGPNNPPEGWGRTSAPDDVTCLCGKPPFPGTTGYMHEAGSFHAKKNMRTPTSRSGRRCLYETTVTVSSTHR